MRFHHKIGPEVLVVTTVTVTFGVDSPTSFHRIPATNSHRIGTQFVVRSAHGSTLFNNHLCPARAGEIPKVESVPSPPHRRLLPRHLLSLPLGLLLRPVLHLPLPDPRADEAPPREQGPPERQRAEIGRASC